MLNIGVITAASYGKYYSCLIIGPSRNDLLTCRPEQDRMFELGSHAPMLIESVSDMVNIALSLLYSPCLRVYQRRVVHHQSFLDERVQRQKVILLPSPVEIPTTERQSTEVLLYRFQETASGLVMQSVLVGDLLVQRVMRTSALKRYLKISWSSMTAPKLDRSPARTPAQLQCFQRSRWHNIRPLPS